MLICPSCGRENPEGARFCNACAQPLEAARPAGRDERRFVSVVFVDLVGFTARSEVLDPEDVRAFLSPYHDLVRRELESFGGVVEKFIGDAVVAVFGAPTTYGDDAERAVRAALAVRDGVQSLEGLDVQVRIAVNTGEALVALGARPELGEAMVAGDVVNTASRLQSAAPVDGVLVGRETYESTRDAIEYEEGPPVIAKGKAEPIRAWIALRPLHGTGERRLSGDLVGRARELEVLRGIWERVAGESVPHLVTVLGPAGIGKTRLAQEFTAAVEELGGRSVHGRSLPYRESSAYFAFATQVKVLCGIFESDTAEVGLAKLRESVPDETVARHLAILLGLDPDGSVDDREELFFSVRVFIEAVACEGPTVLVFEDIHWADRGLLDLIELLAARLRELPIMLVTLARPDLLDSRPSWGGGLTAYTALPLAPLSAEEAHQLAAQRLGEIRAEAALRLAETAEGNPLFIEQLVATVAESSPAGASLPSTIRGILAARLDALPAAERALLLDAAVVGKTFWRGALPQIGAADGVSELLGALERRDLIVRDTVSIIEGEQQFGFKHMLIRDVAYELLPRAERRQRHARVAEFFEARTSELGEVAAALARHWRDAGEPERALGYFIRAAEQAERGWAKDQAAILYREALELVPEGDGSRVADLRRRLALARAASFHIPDARQLMG
ncbi:MAG TPA: AAA family ATPase [Gaiellaceae bacterium]|nr:AAA family ATPase [Gaiellaceae bacterium]